ncbi:P-loop containing nucleoside triphosphate hydrolase protein [Desarmillaria tabescens]|uniref:P-loop containing nucleoside triphosphate hydrolase protein n=1 Tax=Armillaria tabescens TaxID=1929756 RepID=A0AA39NDV4_ARMTA|nr:P-loop containing nucleoside triphosphate hydrolase protein [Desarmillaria tabescens]KAK0463837.1 P-loop containing nucleoside triphosphate hydrolase protein [Desarmillaria tabescens]
MMNMVYIWRSACLRVVSPNNYRVFSTSSPWNAAKNVPIHMEDFACDAIRNFSIIAHIDHGKSTLADRLLELTDTIQKKRTGKNEQVLDKLKVERERGITVKAQTASMFHKHEEKMHLLNLIDTPGHVDFAWEVSRSLAACQGALLLVDASQGVQAQSISVFHIAKERGLKIIPILNKIDLPAAQPELMAAQMEAAFGIDPTEILHISAKTGRGVEEVLKAVIERILPPTGDQNAPLKTFLFDSLYDRYRGVISLISVQGGIIRKGDRIASCHTRKRYDITEIGIMHPEEVPTNSLYPGQVGYVACNMKESSEAHIGDTLHRLGTPVEPMPGFKPSKAMVYAGVFPVDSNDFPKLEESIKRLTLTDRSITIQRESSSALGQGCRLGFLGTLHMDVFRQRLEDEYDANIIITAPTVPFKIIPTKGSDYFISNPTEFPDIAESMGKVKEVQEPVVSASIIAPEEYFGEITDLCFTHRAESLDHRYLDTGSGIASSRIIITCIMPLSEIVTDFFDQLKSRTSGFASFDYEDAGYQKSDLAKMVFLLNGKPVDALALIVHKSAQDKIGRAWVKKLHKVIPRQLFEVPIQAAIGKKVIARETLSAMRADVTAGLYGGHYERKLKHLENQKEGKRRMKKVGTVELPQEAFFDILKK